MWRIFNEVLLRLGLLGKAFILIRLMYLRRCVTLKHRTQITQSGSGILFISKNYDKSPLQSAKVNCGTITGEFKIANALNCFFVT